MSKKQNKNDEILRDMEQYIAHEFGHYFDSVGVKPLLGRIWGILVIAPEPVSLKEIAEKLNISKPAVSTTINFGIQSGMIKKHFNPDFPRESFYYVEKDFIGNIVDPGIKKLQTFQDKFVKAKDKMDESEMDINENKKLKYMYERIEYMMQAFELLVDEYKNFGDIIKAKIKEIEKK